MPKQLRDIAISKEIAGLGDRKEPTEFKLVQGPWAPRGGDERRHAALHKTVTVPSSSGNGDDFYAAANVKMFDRAANRFGHNPDQDEKTDQKMNREIPNTDQTRFTSMPYKLTKEDKQQVNKKKVNEDELITQSIYAFIQDKHLNFKCPKCESEEIPSLNWAQMHNPDNKATCLECGCTESYGHFLSESNVPDWMKEKYKQLKPDLDRLQRKSDRGAQQWQAHYAASLKSRDNTRELSSGGKSSGGSPVDWKPQPRAYREAGHIYKGGRVKKAQAHEETIEEMSFEEVAQKAGYEFKGVNTSHYKRYVKPDTSHQLAIDQNDHYAVHWANDAEHHTKQFQQPQDLRNHLKNIHHEETVNEVLHPSMGVGAYIHDFVHSDSAQLAGRTKQQRINAGIAAFYEAKRKHGIKEDEVNEISKDLALRYIEKATSDYAIQHGRNMVSKPNTNFAKKSERLSNRYLGIVRASQKASGKRGSVARIPAIDVKKEETQVDEASKEKLQFYKDQADKHANFLDNIGKHKWHSKTNSRILMNRSFGSMKAQAKIEGAMNVPATDVTGEKVKKRIEKHHLEKIANAVTGIREGAGPGGSGGAKGGTGGAKAGGTAGAGVTPTDLGKGEGDKSSGITPAPIYPMNKIIKVTTNGLLRAGMGKTNIHTPFPNLPKIRKEDTVNEITKDLRDRYISAAKSDVAERAPKISSLNGEAKVRAANKVIDRLVNIEKAKLKEEETVNELDDKTLRSYFTKAGDSEQELKHKHLDLLIANKNPKLRQKIYQVMMNRRAGMSRAYDKMYPTNEADMASTTSNAATPTGVKKKSLNQGNPTSMTGGQKASGVQYHNKPMVGNPSGGGAGIAKNKIGGNSGSSGVQKNKVGGNAASAGLQKDTTPGMDSTVKNKKVV